MGKRRPFARRSEILRLSEKLGTNANYLLHSLKSYNNKSLRIIVVDDEKIILNGNISVLGEVLPNAEIIGFINPEEAVSYAYKNHIDIALLDIQMGNISGLDVCRKLLSISPSTHVIYLTAYKDYSFDAWETEASGFLLKPLTEAAIRKKLLSLGYLDSDWEEI